MTGLATLGEIVAEHGGVIQTGPFGSQLHQSDYTDDGVPVVMPKDICHGRVNEHGIARIPETKAHALARHILKPGSIVFPRRGEISKCAFIDDSQAGCLCGTGCIKIEPPNEILSPRFLYYYLGLRQVVEWLERNAVGTTMLNLNTKIIGGITIPAIPRAQQDAIVAILSAYDNLIENNRRRIQLLEQAARLLYKEWFVHLRFPGHDRLAGEPIGTAESRPAGVSAKDGANQHVKIQDGVPEGWEKKPLSELCSDVRDSANPKELSPETAYIGLEHIPRRSITLNEWGIAADVTSNKFKFAEGDILFGKIRPYFHKVGFALVDGIASSDAVVVRPTDDHLYHYVLFLLSSDEFVALASKTVREGSKMPRADWKFLLKTEFKIPSATLLGLFDDTVRPICNQLRNLALHNKQLAKTRDLLLPRLMNGEITI